MAYVCTQCENVYHDRPDGGCQGSKRCARGGCTSLLYVPRVSVYEAERRLERGDLFNE